MDCLEGIQRIPDGSVDLICTDPPYFLGMTCNGKRGDLGDLSICRPFYIQLAQEFRRVLKPTGNFYFFTDWRGYAFYYPILAEFLPVRNMIVWDKLSGAGNFYTYSHELIIFGCIDNQENKKGQNVWRIKGFNSGAKKTDGKKIHPTQKPLEIIEKIVLEGAPENGLVLDTFMGSGTTAIACIRNRRNYVGFELNAKRHLIACDRIQEEEKHADGVF